MQFNVIQDFGNIDSPYAVSNL